MTNTEIKEMVTEQRSIERARATVEAAGLEIDTYRVLLRRTWGMRIVVRGNTYPVKETLKALGFRWQERAWRADWTPELACELHPALCRALAGAR